MSENSGIMSERERQIFEEMQAELTRDNVGRGTHWGRRLDRSVLWLAAMIAGLVLLVVGAVVASSSALGVVIGVSGFGVMLLGGVRGWDSLSRGR